MRTDPFHELARVAQQVFRTQARPAAMAIDGYQKGEEFIVQFDLPGVDGLSIDLTVATSSPVQAARSRSTGDDVDLLIGKRPQGTFSRQLFLADTLDSERLVVEYTDDVLTLRVPVKGQAKPRPVAVSASTAASTPIDASSDPLRPQAVGAPA